MKKQRVCFHSTALHWKTFKLQNVYSQLSNKKICTRESRGKKTITLIKGNCAVETERISLPKDKNKTNVKSYKDNYAEKYCESHAGTCPVKSVLIQGRMSRKETQWSRISNRTSNHLWGFHNKMFIIGHQVRSKLDLIPVISDKWLHWNSAAAHTPGECEM